MAAWSRGMILPLGGSGLGFDSRSGPFFLFCLRDEIDAYGRQLSIALIFLLQRAILKVATNTSIVSRGFEVYKK